MPPVDARRIIPRYPIPWFGVFHASRVREGGHCSFLCLTLGMVYRLPLRQTQGLIRSISKLMLLEISVPDFSTLSRRGRGLSLPARPKIKITDPVHLAIDSTGEGFR